MPRKTTEAPANDDLAEMAGRACPICGKTAVVKYRPFCSKRCADVDLQRWFTGTYAVPVVEEDRSADGDDAE
ncbi:DNA gyrase inhibitor YacG [Salinarimonas sp.]|uniref:DNA gyrase inhibitor YacG n=1 Tax=Salinarimonas sp. TaxID=2766526 RepID=UPI0035B502D7